MTYRAPARRKRLDVEPGRLPFPLPVRGGLERSSADIASGGRTFVCPGWAWPFDGDRVRSASLRVDGGEPVPARLTLRPDVAELIGDPAAVLSGFEAELALPPGAGAGDAVEITGEIRGLSGGVWALPRETVLLVGPATDGGATATGEPSPASELSAPPAPGERELERLRMGYDPWHAVALVEPADAAAVAGPALAALDAVAERLPHLELLISGAAPESVTADRVRRSTDLLGLADRVTVPTDTSDPGYWRLLADFRVDAALCTDLDLLIDAMLSAAGEPVSS